MTFKIRILLSCALPLLFSACKSLPGTNSTSNTTLETSAGKVTHIAERVDLECGGEDFRLFRVTLENGTEGVTLFKGDKEVRTERLPTQTEVNKFKLDPLRKTDEGFELSVEYGDRYYHSKRFGFDCVDGEFQLSRMKSERFDTQNPGKISRKESAVRPRRAWAEFGLRLYLID
ncbi:MAG: hypothetical protein IPM63_01790 [Acidobacteriota bacterium]|nr:MAG: hypothetical protein IPM63_01790 [Acidobacteriota bacterium]